MPTTPRGIWTPSDSDDFDIITDMAATAVSVDDAITAAMAGVPLPARYIGTDAQRLAMTAPNLRNGIEFQTTDTNLVWQRSAGIWSLVPGQILASGIGPTTSSTGAGTLVGSIISTPVLPVGQRLKIVSSFSQYTNGTGTSVIDTKIRNNAANVSVADFDMNVPSRAYNAGGALVTSGRGCTALFTTTTAAKVSMGIFVASAASILYGLDGTHYWIESA